ncbi:flippase [Natrononativus amylolyticus]|uniref:flippase n=1 Tax=Natrononativus amylolyticus TaxID=2963434 RepID=UPI0020CE5EC4|nr:flippase [Natrononativus amylolyticus]
MDTVERIVEGFKAALGARLVTAIANGLLMLVLARWLLSPDEYGLLFLLLAIVAIAQLGADLGLGRSAARYVSEYKETDGGKVPFILRTSLAYRLVLFGLVAAILIGAGDLIALVLETPELASLLVLGAVYLGFNSTYSYATSLLQGFNRVQLSSLVEVVHSVARLLFVILLTVLGFGVVGAVVGYVVGGLLASALGLWLLYTRFYTAFDDDGGSRSLRTRLLKYSVPLTASHGANVLDKQIDTVLVAFFLNPVAVSYYVLSKQITEFVLVPAGSLGVSVSPTYGEQKATDGLERAARIYESSLEYVFVLYIPAAVGMILVAEPAVTLVFGAEYAGAAPVLQVLGVFVVFAAVTDVTTQSLDYLGRATARAVAKGATSVANVGLNVVLIPVYGVTGAAVATVVTFGIYTLANVYVIHQELSLDLERILRFAGLTTAISVGMGLAVSLAVPYASSLLALAGVIALGIAVWGALVVASGAVDVRETLALIQ